MSVEKDIQSEKQVPGGEEINRPQFSVVIPVYNEETNVQPLFSRLTAVMTALGKSYEIIFVDDGSSDGSYQALK
jgi:glycosyltransferase involved in cell wall biosynthesis